jgi:hypothetical protein
MSSGGAPAVDVRWGELNDAFGPATRLPELLAAVSTARGNKLLRCMEKLCEHVLHQGTIYSASPPAVHALIEMSAAAAPRDKAIFYGVLVEFASSAREAIRDGRAIPCCSGGEPEDGAAILQHILQAHDQFAPDLPHAESEIRGFAGALLAASADAGPAAAQLVRDRCLVEADPGARLQLVNGATRVRRAFSDWLDFLNTTLARETDPACRFALRHAQVSELTSTADAAAVDDLVATFLQTEDQRFFGALELLGAPRELAALLNAFEGATDSDVARILADRLLRLIFHDQRTGWGQTSYSIASEGGASARGSQDVGKNMLKMIFKLIGTMILWKLFPFLLRRKLRQSTAKRKGREKIEYWGLAGAAPEIPAKLTPDQQTVLAAFAAKPVLWEFRTNLWELFGLPDNAPALREFIAARA